MGILAVLGGISGAGTAAKESLMQSQKDNVTRDLEASRQTMENLRQQKNLEAAAAAQKSTQAFTSGENTLLRQANAENTDRTIAANLNQTVVAGGIAQQAAGTAAKNTAEQNALLRASTKEIHDATNKTALDVAKLHQDTAKVVAGSSDAKVLQQEVSSLETRNATLRTALLDPLKNNPDDPQVKKSIAILDASDRALDQMRAELHAKLGMAPPKTATPAPVGINLGPYGGAPKTSASPMTAPSNQGYTPIPSVLQK